MVNCIVHGISRALNEEFGDDYEIHMEEIRQDLKEPCFLINCLEPSIKEYPGKRYLRRNPFCIQYFPCSQEEQKECNDVAERMLWKLECIRTEDGELRGTDMKYQVIDGVMNFFVSYSFFVRQDKTEDSMEMLETKIEKVR